MKTTFPKGPFFYFCTTRNLSMALLSLGFVLLQHVTICYADSSPDIATKGKGADSVKESTTAAGKWLPIPVFITEPAFGYGLGLGLAYIRPHEVDGPGQKVPKVQTPTMAPAGGAARKQPPDITGIVGGYTDKESWFVGGGYSGSWRNDTRRYVGAAIYADVTSEYYILDEPFDFSLRGFGLLQDLKFRLGESDLFLGGKFLYLDTESKFDFIAIGNTEIEIGDIRSTNVGVAIEASLDRRDNTFTPNSGQLVKLALWGHDEAIGSDYDYWLGTLKALAFLQLYERFVLGLRLEGSVVDGSPPFYAYPFIKLRGIPALRYQGKRVLMLEAEGRWVIRPRWSALGFLGAGRVYGDDPALDTQDNIIAGGVGGRYLFMPEEGLWLGMDVARGPEDTYVYITVGSAW